jgi:hypothetical protein
MNISDVHVYRKEEVSSLKRNNMDRAELINRFIYLYKFKRYLEIGVQYGETFKKVIAEEKDGVDSNHPATYEMTSDSFFAEYKGSPYDIILIDGNHNGDYVYRDITRALEILSKNGIVICHDCNPIEELYQVRVDHPDRIAKKIGTWQGTVWRAWLKLRSELDREMFVIDANLGLGVIKKGVQEKIDNSYCLMDFLDFRKHHKYLLNLISIEQFDRRYPDSEIIINNDIEYDPVLKYSHLKRFLKDTEESILNICIEDNIYYEYLKKDNYNVQMISFYDYPMTEIQEKYDIVVCIDILDRFSYGDIDFNIKLISSLSSKAFFGLSKYTQDKSAIIQENENFWGKKLSIYYKELFLGKPDDRYFFMRAVK